MSTISSTQRMQDAYDAERAQARENSEEELSRAKEDYEKNLTEAKKDYNERLLREREEAQGDVRKLKDEMYDRKGKRVADDSSDYQRDRAEFSRYREETEKDAARRIAST